LSILSDGLRVMLPNKVYAKYHGMTLTSIVGLNGLLW
jgi:hypothetical protein